MLAVTYFYREPRNTGLSIEGIFRLVRESLAGRVKITEVYCDASLSRRQNTARAAKMAGAINHITGDVNFLAIGMRGKKNILTIHDFGFYENPVHNKLVKLVYRLFWFYFPLKNVAIVTVVSEFTKAKLVHYFKFPEARIRVIYDPVKPVFKFVKKEQVNEPLRVLMLGTGKHKNLDNLVEAAKDKEFHLDIVGWPAPDEVAKLDGYGISYKVYNKLTDEEVYERYVACDVLFIASFYEGFGMPIIEAQAVGRPVVTSNIGAMKEVGEGTTLMVDPHKPEEIRKAILSLKDRQLYDKMVELGKGNAAKYDYRKIADEYLAVYQELSKQ
jgi:glycosyltransferase involved in cell wall biosynthesis